MKSIANQYRDLKEGKMSQQNFMRNLRMTMPQFVTNVTSFGDAVKILKNKSIIVETTVKENFDFNKSAIESATGDKISHTEEDDFGEIIYWSTENPYVNYYISSDEQIIKYDGKTGERYPIGDLRNYDEPPNDDYEPDTDADYEEPRDDFDMAEGEGDKDEIDAMIKKMEDEKVGEEAVKSQYDLGEAKPEDKEFDEEEEEEETYDFEYDEDEMFNPVYMNEAKKKEEKVEYSKQQANPTELRLGIRTELECDSDMELDKAKEIAYKNIIKDPIYYTKLKLSGVEAHPKKVKVEKEVPAKKKEEKNYSVQQANPTELRLGIRTELEHGDMELDKAKEIAYKNIAKDPIYYTKLKLSGLEAHPKKVKGEKEVPVKKAKKESAQLVDLVNGMQKVKMPKADKKKKIKEGVDEAMPFADLPADPEKYKIVRDSKNYIIKATNADGVEFQKGDTVKTYDGEEIKIAKFEESQGKVKAIYNKGMFFAGIDIDGLEAPKPTMRPGVDMGASFEKMKKSMQEIVRETISEYFDGRDNLINPLAAEDENN
jgi:hypothetical protein